MTLLGKGDCLARLLAGLFCAYIKVNSRVFPRVLVEKDPGDRAVLET
jgi:hypothetical protein